MKPETAAFLAKAKDVLDRAAALLVQGFTDEAGRAAYLAGFHAAQAMLFERRDRSPKTHSGVQTQFAELAKHEASIDSELRAFLGRAYALKAIADYETGPDAHVATAQAEDAIRTASRFVAAISALLENKNSK